VNYFVPRLRLGMMCPPQTTYCDKIGGLPWGLPKKQWPLCRQCRKPLTFNAQFSHDTSRLNLGAAGRVLFIFTCNHNPGFCDTWEADSGANAVFFVDGVELSKSLTPAPSISTDVEPEGLVFGWRKRKDRITASEYKRLFDDKTAGLVKYQRSISGETKFGGAPLWLQGGCISLPKPKGKFLLQLNHGHDFEGRPPTAEELDVAPSIKGQKFWEYGQHWRRGQIGTNGKPSHISVDKDGTWGCETANFGGGLAYVFMRKDHSCYMITQN